MESLLRSVYGRAEAEYVIKKSRFIATVCEVKTEAEAAAFIESVRKHYWDARHNCSAFQIGAGGQIQRCGVAVSPDEAAGAEFDAAEIAGDDDGRIGKVPFL